MTDKPSYEELEQQLAEAKKKTNNSKRRVKTNKVMLKNISYFGRNFEGKANLREFPRETRAKKTESPLQYFSSEVAILASNTSHSFWT